MKRSEIRQRLGPALREFMQRSTLCQSSAGPNHDLMLVEEGAHERIAEALGVTVEPDEPPLPDMLELVQGGIAEKGGYQAGTPEGIWISVHGSCDNRTLLGRLVSAYNVRPYRSKP